MFKEGNELKEIANNFKALMNNNKGASNVEIIVWISVVLVIATALFIFREAITDFIDRARGVVDGLEVN